jgi:mono/diheme cytochrome c family protein
VVVGLMLAAVVHGQQPRQESEAPSLGQKLYAQHCAACHGVRGDGQGSAALYLYPKPRNFQIGKFRLISTPNGVPSRADLAAVLLRGMPGSSMPPWGHLPDEQREALIDEVYRLFREGVRQRYLAHLKEQEQLSDEELRSEEVQTEIREVVQRQTTPQPSEPLPTFPQADEGAIARGRELYLRQSCHSCHGTGGKGDGVQKMIDDEGFPTRPRDLTRGIYKGGHDLASLYLRMYYGMPGTPMPASKNLTPQEIADILHYLRSLSTEAQREAVVLRRQTIPAVRVARLPADPSEAAWQAAGPPVAIGTFPLWWRDDAEPSLRVQAAHDGQTLAIRLSWQDATEDGSSPASDSFEDMAAVALFRGPAEPLIGMGATQEPVELWHWRAGGTGPAIPPLDDYPFEGLPYTRLVQGSPPDFWTARAAGNPLTDAAREAGHLGARGPGSTTFRPPGSRAIATQAQRELGRWNVVLSRPLAVAAEGGLPLAAGQRCSIALALWDGSAHERGPQKQVSIWHDLEVR